jgi:type I restriction enzyme S subunit
VKPGYKQTEVGVIPTDWQTAAVADLVEPSAPICYGVVQVGQHIESGVPIVAIKFVKEIAHAPLHRTAINLEQPYARSRPKGGDVLISIKGTIGRVGIVPNGFHGNISRELARLRVREDSCPEYIAHQLESGATQERIMRSVVGTTRLEFSIAALRKFPLPIPPTKKEQRAIASALSDVDGLLGGRDRLIAKKRDLKQAAMQQLLTGSTRLPGFHGEWEVKTLGGLAAFYKGQGLPKSALNESGAEPCIHYGELFTRYPETIGEIFSRTDSAVGVFRSVANDVLMPTSDVTPRGLAKASCVRVDGVILGGDILVIRSDTNLIHGPFLSLVIRYEETQVLQLVTGSTVYHLYGSDMKNFTFSIPPLPEQIAIAEVLSDMDAELAALEQQRDKTRALKQAMMQELLTGRTRLV